MCGDEGYKSFEYPQMYCYEPNTQNIMIKKDENCKCVEPAHNRSS
jgi:hypothetical protein